jgi:hypothetical protein
MFLGGNTTIVQGGAEVFTLDKPQLGAIAALKGDGYFKDPSFWREVLVTFQKQGNGLSQRKTLQFLSGNTALITFSPTAMTGTWEIREAMIMDKDRGIMVIERADIPNVAMYDLTITTA